jgi:lipopolysaccharide/colanic/teichoic acid biosynthesis glycosyltransferase
MQPGITGLVEVGNRNSLTWPKNLEYDLEYV